MYAPQFLRRRAGLRPNPVVRALVGLVFVSLVGLIGCSSHPPRGLGEMAGALRPCPPSPNCVCSESEDPLHAIAPIQTVGTPEVAFQKAEEVIRGWNRCTVIRFDPDFLHAECKSAIFRFVDDLELALRPDQREIAVRSASRVGHSDFGVNRRRVERLREALIKAGVAVPDAQPS
ncbi:MAG: DUF1499 domain-containing protein [Myxococcota bacterium]|nr:DUF1499 domain-containing protein [Myxococcota bacterium]